MPYKRALLLAFLAQACAHQRAPQTPPAAEDGRRYTVLMATTKAGSQRSRRR